MWGSGLESSWVNIFRCFENQRPTDFGFLSVAHLLPGHHPICSHEVCFCWPQAAGRALAQVMDEYDSCRPAFMKLDIKRKSYGPAMILGEARLFGALGHVGLDQNLSYQNYHTIFFLNIHKSQLFCCSPRYLGLEP